MKTAQRTKKERKVSMPHSTLKCPVAWVRFVLMLVIDLIKHILRSWVQSPFKSPATPDLATQEQLSS